MSLHETAQWSQVAINYFHTFWLFGLSVVVLYDRRNRK